jgi:HK97 family phage portal protein
MSLLSWLGRRIGLSGPFSKFWAAFAGQDTSWSGESINAEKALQIAAVWRAVRLEAETVGTLPLNTYEQPADGGDPKLVRDGPYDDLLRISPNADLTTTEFWEAMVGAARLVGNGYALKHRAAGTVRSLEIPNAAEPFRDNNNALRYRGKDSADNPFDVPASEMFHLKGFSFGGDEGLSMVRYGAQSLATMLAGNKTAGKIFKSGLGTSGVIEYNGTLNEPDREKLEKILANYQGTHATDKLLVLEGGMKFSRISMNAVDAELLSTIRFGIEEIARWADMPPVLLMHSAEGVTQWGSGIEAIILAWLQLGLRARLTRIEKTIGKRLIEPKDQRRFFVKFNIDALLRGDAASQAQLFSAAAQNGWLTRNEIRRLLDLPRSTDAGADQLTVQVNMTFLKDLGSQNQQQATAARNALMQLLGLSPDPNNEAGVIVRQPRQIAEPV